MMSKIPIALFNQIDWELLREQKAEMCAEVDRAALNREFRRADLFSGIVSLLDSLQDAAVDEVGIPEKDVFGEMK